MNAPADDLLFRAVSDELNEAEERELADRLHAEPGLAADLYRLSLEEALLHEWVSQAGGPVAADRPRRMAWKLGLAFAAAGMILAGIGILGRKRDPVPEAVAEGSDPASVLEACLAAGLQNRRADFDEALDRLRPLAARALPVARGRLRECLRAEGMTAEEAWSRYRELSRDRRARKIHAHEMSPASLHEALRSQGRLLEIALLQRIESRLELWESFERGVPDLTSHVRAILSFEHFAERGDWEKAALCLADGGADRARDFAGRIGAARRQSGPPLEWGSFRMADPGLPPLAVLCSSEDVRALPEGDGRARFTDTHAFAWFQVDGRAGEHRILDVLQGDVLDLERMGRGRGR